MFHIFGFCVIINQYGRAVGREAFRERMLGLTLTQDGIAWLARAVVLILVTPLHECAHGFVAWRLGDSTAHDRGRLTLNPIKHLDLWGSLMLILLGFGWAKPVPVNPNNFRKPKRDMALTALAGPLANILFALAVMVVYRVMMANAPYYRESYAYQLALSLISYIIYMSLLLAVFNLLPAPPLDGSRIFGVFLPEKYYFGVMRYERYIMIAVMVLLYTGLLSRPLQYLTQQLVGLLLFLTTPIGWIA